MLGRDDFDVSGHEKRMQTIFKILRKPEERPELFIMRDLLIEHDEQNSLWRFTTC